ncbi:MAG: DinB family protein [Pyrinomonadaceae bacterium]|nr:DinB family protein [Pyrinomonadaceae bacterium]
MIERQAWFERRFSFDYLPTSMYANVVERLRGTPARLEDRLLNLPQAILTRRDGDKWSIQEHAGHLLDLEDLEMKRLEDYAAGRETLTPADLQNRKTFEANHNSKEIAELLSEFRRERMKFVERLEALDAEFIERSALHPRLKIPMRVIDFAFFKAEHDDHHMARISELIKKWA